MIIFSIIVPFCLGAALMSNCCGTQTHGDNDAKDDHDENVCPSVSINGVQALVLVLYLRASDMSS